MLIKARRPFVLRGTPKSLYFNHHQFLAGVPAALLAGQELLSPSRRALAVTKHYFRVAVIRPGVEKGRG